MDGGGITTSGTIVIRKSTFDANTSLHSGGAIYMDGPVFVGDTINALDCRNCIFTKNLAFDEGGAMYLSNAKMAAANSTFYLNSSWDGTTYPVGEGDSVYIDGGSNPSLSTMHNCIVQALEWDSNGIVAIDGALLEVKFCCTFPVMELDEGNMTVAPPLFVDPENGDFHLRGDSPCINVGSNDLVVSALDFEGEARIVAGRVDMGALEHDDDEDGDGIPNDYEAEGCTSPYAFDTDGDGLSDFQEIFNCNQSNSIKICTDPCDADTDDDGLVDGNAGSEDLNANGIWEPELGETHPGEWDSDGDGLPDGLERGLIEPETIDTDLSAGFFVEDKDPASITDPTNPDTDGDGILDGEEDVNRDGKYNPDEGETDPVNIDSDVDGALDDEDCCNNSDFRPTVVIGSCDSGVENRLVDCGCTISDRVIQCADRTKNHGQFVSCVAKMTNNLRREKIITGKEKGALQSCAAKR
jgi:hypothetical protein